MKEEITEKVIRLFNAGKSRKEIAEECNLVSPEAVTYILRKNGLSYAKRDREKLDEKRNKILDMYAAGYAMEDITSEMKVSSSYVYDLIAKNPIQVNKVSTTTTFPYQLRCEWTRTVNMFRKQVFGKEPFPMPKFN